MTDNILSFLNQNRPPLWRGEEIPEFRRACEIFAGEVIDFAQGFFGEQVGYRIHRICTDHVRKHVGLHVVAMKLPDQLVFVKIGDPPAGNGARRQVLVYIQFIAQLFALVLLKASLHMFHKIPLQVFLRFFGIAACKFHGAAETDCVFEKGFHFSRCNVFAVYLFDDVMGIGFQQRLLANLAGFERLFAYRIVKHPWDGNPWLFAMLIVKIFVHNQNLLFLQR